MSYCLCLNIMPQTNNLEKNKAMTLHLKSWEFGSIRLLTMICIRFHAVIPGKKHPRYFEKRFSDPLTGSESKTNQFPSLWRHNRSVKGGSIKLQQASTSERRSSSCSSSLSCPLFPTFSELQSAYPGYGFKYILALVLHKTSITSLTLGWFTHSNCMLQRFQTSTILGIHHALNIQTWP